MEPPPALPDHIRRVFQERGFTELRFFAQKRLIQKDICLNNDSLDIEDVTNIPHWTPGEQAELDGRRGIPVTLMNIELLLDRNLTLKKKPGDSASSSYMLCKGWNGVKKENIITTPDQTRLKVGQMVRLWWCRRLENNAFSVFVQVVAI